MNSVDVARAKEIERLHALIGQCEQGGQSTRQWFASKVASTQQEIVNVKDQLERLIVESASVSASASAGSGSSPPRGALEARSAAQRALGEAAASLRERLRSTILEREQLEAEKEDVQARCVRLKDDSLALIRESALLRAELTQAQRELAEMQAQQEKRIVAAEMTIVDQVKFERLRDKSSALQEEILRCESTIDELQSDIDNLEVSIRDAKRSRRGAALASSSSPAAAIAIMGELGRGGGGGGGGSALLGRHLSASPPKSSDRGAVSRIVGSSNNNNNVRVIDGMARVIAPIDTTTTTTTTGGGGGGGVILGSRPLTEADLIGASNSSSSLRAIAPLPTSSLPPRALSVSSSSISSAGVGVTVLTAAPQSSHNLRGKLSVSSSSVPSLPPTFSTITVASAAAPPPPAATSTSVRSLVPSASLAISSISAPPPPSSSSSTSALSRKVTTAADTGGAGNIIPRNFFLPSSLFPPKTEVGGGYFIGGGGVGGERVSSPASPLSASLPRSVTSADAMNGAGGMGSPVLSMGRGTVTEVGSVKKEEQLYVM